MTTWRDHLKEDERVEYEAHSRDADRLRDVAALHERRKLVIRHRCVERMRRGKLAAKSEITP